MKNFGKILMVLVSVMLLGGCTAKINYNVKINSDNSMNVSAIVAYDDEMIDSIMSSSNGETTSNDTTSTPSYTDEDRWNYLEQAFNSNEMPINKSDNVKRYDKDGFKGYEITLKVNNINDITGDKTNFSLTDSSDLENEIMFVKQNGGYEASIGFDNSTTSSYSQYTNYGMNLEYKFVVSLPTKAGDNNATSVSEDGKTLTWDLTKFNGDKIKFIYKPSNMIMYIIFGAIILIVVALAIVFVLEKKNKNKKDPKEGTPVLVNDTPSVNEPINDAVSMASSVSTPVSTTQNVSTSNTDIESLFDTSEENSLTDDVSNTQNNFSDNSNPQINNQASEKSDNIEKLFDSNN